MANLIHIKQPFSKEIDSMRKIEKGESIKDLCKSLNNGQEEFNVPTICLLNDEPVMRSEWESKKVKENDTVTFATVIGDPITIIVSIIAVVAAVGLTLALNVPTPTTPGDIPEPDPVFTLRGQTNRIRLGDPIEEHFGRVKIFPSYAAVSYNKYIDNEQFLFSLFCLGQGEYDVENIFIEDTAISNFPDVEYQFYSPGESVVLFRDNVATSAEVGNIELFGSNQPEYSGKSGPFTANAPQTQTDILEVDVSLPGGLYESQDDGTLGEATVSALFEYRQIDDNGVAITGWATLATFNETLATNTPQRYTLSKSVTPARYEVRANRITTWTDDIKISDKIVWETLKAYLPNVGTYGDVTLLAVKARASNNLNDSSRSSINLFATRKLPIWNGTTWSTPTATRSAVWAFIHMFKTQNGGLLSDDKFFDLDSLVETHNTLVGEGRNFDWSFDTRSTVWQNASLACRAVRGIPMLQGSKLLMILERPKTIPTAVFGPANIIKNSLEWDIKIYNENEYDGVEVEYTDPVTWKSETVECFLNDSQGDFLEPIKLPGVTNRQLAYQEGMYEESKRRYLRENVTFRTGLEGYVPTLNDLIIVNHDLPRWGQGGTVLSIDGNTITVDTSLVFTDGETHKVLLRTKLGDVSGPHTVTEGTNDKEVILSSSVALNDFYFDGSHEKPVFLFGVENMEGKLITVTDISSSGEEEIEITGSNYDSRVFDFDTAITQPAPPPASIIDADDKLFVTGLNISGLGNSTTEAIVTWDRTNKASSYLLNYGNSANRFTDVIEVPSNSHRITLPYLPLYVRVAAKNSVTTGPYSSVVSLDSSDFSAVSLIAPSNINLTVGYGSISLDWSRVVGVDYYQVRITLEDPNVETNPAYVTYEVENLSATINGLLDNTTYWVQVRSAKRTTTINDIYSPWSSPHISGTTGIIINGTFYGSTVPGDPGEEGVVWFDQGNDNEIYRWDGSNWVSVADGRILDLSDRIDTTEANLITLENAVDQYDNRYALRVDGDGGVVGYELLSGAGQNSFKIKANEFSVVDDSGGAQRQPFVINNGQIFLNADTFIQSLSAGKIASGDISAAIINMIGTGSEIKSSNFINNSSGFRIRGSGDAQFNNITAKNGNFQGVLTGSTIQASTLVLDTGMQVAQSDRLDRPANIEVSLTNSSSSFLGSPEVSFLGRNNNSSDLSTRVIGPKHRFNITASYTGTEDKCHVYFGNSKIKSIPAVAVPHPNRNLTGFDGDEVYFSGSVSFSYTVSNPSSSGAFTFELKSQIGDDDGLNGRSYSINGDQMTIQASCNNWSNFNL